MWNLLTSTSSCVLVTGPIPTWIFWLSVPVSMRTLCTGKGLICMQIDSRRFCSHAGQSFASPEVSFYLDLHAWLCLGSFCCSVHLASRVMLPGLQCCSTHQTPKAINECAVQDGMLTGKLREQPSSTHHMTSSVTFLPAMWFNIPSFSWR